MINTQELNKLKIAGLRNLATALQIEVKGDKRKRSTFINAIANHYIGYAKLQQPKVTAKSASQVISELANLTMKLRQSTPYRHYYTSQTNQAIPAQYLSFFVVDISRKVYLGELNGERIERNPLVEVRQYDDGTYGFMDNERKYSDRNKFLTAVCERLTTIAERVNHE